MAASASPRLDMCQTNNMTTAEMSASHFHTGVSHRRKPLPEIDFVVSKMQNFRLTLFLFFSVTFRPLSSLSHYDKGQTSPERHLDMIERVTDWLRSKDFPITREGEDSHGRFKPRVGWGARWPWPGYTCSCKKDKFSLSKGIQSPSKKLELSCMSVLAISGRGAS